MFVDVGNFLAVALDMTAMGRFFIYSYYQKKDSRKGGRVIHSIYTLVLFYEH